MSENANLDADDRGSSDREVRLEHLTWPDVRDRLEGGFRTAVVAVGAVEQHGPHLPLMVDAAHGDRLAVEVARRLRNALVAPTIRVGCSDHHLSFPGTISLRPDTLRAVCLDYADSLSGHGFRRICFVPTHGGNFSVLEEALPELNETVAPEAAVRAFTDLEAVVALWRRVAEEAAGLGSRVGGHADVAESSITLALRPDLVRIEEATSGYTGPTDRQSLEEIISRGFESVTENGILGDARGADAEIGQRCIAELADLVVSELSGGG